LVGAGRGWKVIDRSELAAAPEAYSFSWPGPEAAEALTRSVERFGLLHPLLAISEGGRLTVVSGWRRLAALAKLGTRSTPVGLLEPRSPQHLWDALLEDRLLSGPLNPVELGLYARKRMEATGEDLPGVAAAVGVRPGLPEKAGSWEDHLWVAGLPDRHRAGFAEGRFPAQGVRVLSRAPREDALAVLELLGGARVGVNKFAELARWLLECAWREGLPVVAWAEREGLGGGAGDPEALRREARRRRFPTVTVWEESFPRDCSRARLPAEARLSHASGFEGGRLTCSLAFSSLGQLRALAAEVVAAVDEGRLDPLSRYLG
jgi:hypothetical protein